MGDENARIRLKLGAIEIEYEGRASFLKDDLFNLMQKVVSFHSENAAAIPAGPASESNGQSTNETGSTFDHSTNTIAAHLGAKTATELAIAASAHLTFVKKQDKFTRREMDNEMKDATTYYSKNMSSNLSKSITTLVKAKRLNQVGKDTYALSATERSTLESTLAQAL